MTSQQRTQADERSVLEEFLPAGESVLIEHLVVDAPATAAYEAVSQLNVADMHSPFVHGLFWARALPEWLHRMGPSHWHRVGGGGTYRHATLDDDVSSDELVLGSNWVLLGERQGQEIVIGAAGRFWRPVAQWTEIDADSFASFSRLGEGKVALAFSVRPYGHRSIVTFEIRTGFADEPTRRVFRWYWRSVRPFVRLISRGMLRAIRDTASRAS